MELNNNDRLKKSAFGGMVWKLSERVCARLVSLAVSIVLARILVPEDYSLVSIVAIFFVFCNVFISGGLNTALMIFRIHIVFRGSQARKEMVPAGCSGSTGCDCCIFLRAQNFFIRRIIMRCCKNIPYSILSRLHQNIPILQYRKQSLLLRMLTVRKKQFQSRSIPIQVRFI